MKVHLQFVTLSKIRQYEEFLGIQRIYQYLRENNVECRIEQLFSDIGFEEACKKIDLTYDIFGFSIYYDSAAFIIKICEYIKSKKTNAICFLGSQYASSTYDMLLKDYSCIDAVILGHGEKVILNMVRDLENNFSLYDIVCKSKHIAARYSLDGKENAQININETCNPGRVFYKQNRQLIASIVAKQGCSGVCTFCSCNDKFSCKSPDAVFDEIISIYSNHRIQFFNFVDSTITDMGVEGKINLRRLCTRLKDFPVKFSFRCFIRADSFKNNTDDRALLMLMKEVGFSNFFIGIESGNDKDLQLYGKGIKVTENQECLHMLREFGFDYKYGFIMINPYSDQEKLYKNFEFLAKNKCWDSCCFTNRLQIYPRTKMYQNLKRKGLITEDYSYISNIYGYKIIDPFAQEAFGFIKDYVVERIEKIDRFQQFNYLFNYIKPILGEAVEEFDYINDTCKTELAEINQNYYSIIYKERNLQKARMELDTYIEKLESIDESIIKYNNLLMKSFLLHRSNSNTFKVNVSYT